MWKNTAWILRIQSNQICRAIKKSAWVYEVQYVRFTEEKAIATGICFSNTVTINFFSFTKASTVEVAEAATMKENKKRQ